ncbi:MAG: FKBP-type peptidyl-prolyl cis-trans isomerase [Bacteroidota bacterium]
MKHLFVLASVAALLGGCRTSDDTQGLPTTENLGTRSDSVSYAIGLNIGESLHRDSVQFQVLPLLQGLVDARGDTAKRLLSTAGVEATMMAYQQDMAARRMENMRRKAAENKKKGDEFLAENAKEAGVVKLPSGLQYRVLREGTGPVPTRGQFVTAHYRGTLINGQEFDNSYQRGEPATFRVDGVIAGWTEALQLMKVGSKWTLYIPPALAYGDQGSGPIGPGEALIFEVELIGVK